MTTHFVCNLDWMLRIFFQRQTRGLVASSISQIESDDAPAKLERFRPIVATRRFQLLGALLLAAAAPFIFQLVGPTPGTAGANTVALVANSIAILMAFWMRLSIGVYPGIRRSYVIVPSVATAHGIIFAALLASRLPYARISLLLGVVLHVAWLYLIYVAVERRLRRRMAIVPCGRVGDLPEVENIQWLWLKRPRLHDARGCDAITADFAADLPDEWESFLAEAAISGRVVYQYKQLAESLTGRVKLTHLSENTFGSLLPSRGYFYAKDAIDFAVAVIALPIVLPVMAIIAILIYAEGTGSPLFRQKRVGHRGTEFTLFKFRTMRPHDISDARMAVTTADADPRITKVGGFLRKYRLDELPQVFNILKGQMSWIGPRPEARELSIWYRDEIPFYVYRHVVKPGISGWAQVNQGHVAALDAVHEKLEYDFYYIKNFSPWLDLLILLRTIKTILTGFGSK